LIFVESYGAVAFDRPDFVKSLSASRLALERTIDTTGREVVSAFVESPTFGGSSWFAHLSLLSGVDARDPETNTLLMTEKRDTLVTAFARQGFHTIGVLPGLKKSWPEGAFYGFDEVCDAKRLKYPGPWFGWFGIPDQFTLARIGEMMRRSDIPSFVFFPTLSTHFPFGPTPPYQPDWQRVLTDDPYDAPVLYRALGNEPDWRNLGPSYIQALQYAYESIGGYLRQSANRDLIAIVLGDHQPPAAVSGEGARWDVPVHVIARRREILDRLQAHGFKVGLTPTPSAIGRVNSLLPVLLAAFGMPGT
jgi:hypothetical protein